MAETKKVRCRYDFKYLELFSAGMAGPIFVLLQKEKN